MTRRLMLAGFLLASLANAVPASAHENYRIIGTLTKVSAKEIEVKRASDGKLIGMDFDATSRVTRDKKKLTASDLKVGLSVVVDARGDSLEELLVREVRIVPATAKK